LQQITLILRQNAANSTSHGKNLSKPEHDCKTKTTEEKPVALCNREDNNSHYSLLDRVAQADQSAPADQLFPETQNHG